MVMAINFVNIDDSRFGVFVRRSDHAIPDVRRIDKARCGRIFDRAVRQIGSFKSEFVGKCRGFAIRTAVHDVICAGDGIKNGLRPGFAVKFGLKPFLFIHRFHKSVGDGHGDIKIR